ncbi:MAG: hypothetical protein R3F20_09100 [Planctomycetota bacterium]
MPVSISRARGLSTGTGILILGLSLALVSPSASIAQTVELPAIFTLLAANDEGGLGTTVSLAGDVNGDGLDDLIVGIYAYLPAGGTPIPSRVRVISGLDGSIIHSFLGTGALDVIDGTATGLGDINGDGFADFALGARLADFAGLNTGRVTVFSGIDGSVIRTFDGTGIGDELGTSLASAGDIDGDGIEDLIVGARSNDDGGLQAGSVYVFSGASGALLHQFMGAVGDELGLSVAGPGDVNGDGVPDIVSGSPYADFPVVNAGYVRVYSGLDGSVLLNAAGAVTDGRWGATVGRAGDINGDGFADVIAGASLEASGGVINSGRVAVLSGFDGSVLFQDAAGGADYRIGHAVAGFGDLNGDGYDDFGYSVPGDPTVLGATGRFDIYSGFDQTLLLRQFSATGTTRFGWGFASAGDADGDGRADIAVGTTNFPGPLLGGVQVFNLPFHPFPGSRADLRLWTGVNGAPALLPYVKSATAGDSLTVWFFSDSTYVGEVPVFAAQLRATGAPIGQPVGYPEAWINPSPFSSHPVVVIHDGNAGPLAPSLMPSAGLSFAFNLPVGLSGFSIMLQGFALAPSPVTGNVIFTATDGGDIEVM